VTAVSSTWVTILSASGGILAAIVTYLGMRITQRQAAKAQQTTAEIETAKVDAQAYAEARTIWDSLIKDLRNTVADQRREITKLREETASFRARLEDLEQKRSGDRYAIHVLTVYARQLLKVITAADLVPPPPPEGLDLEG
jgi:uncharacterized membrane protein